MNMRTKLLCSALLWKAFKDRLGTSEFSNMHFNLISLLERSADLERLAFPFSSEEINAIVQQLPNGKSPGPNDFNNEFTKKCWEVISTYYYDRFNDFYKYNIYLQSINNSHIVLVLKVDNPSKVGNFMPLSLLNSSIKLITKAMANRLQVVILKLIHQNQYGFIKSRSIEDCRAWSFEYMHICHKSKKEVVILKLNFEKTFDKIEHEVLLQVMEHKGFPSKWIRWVKDILSSGTSSVLLNGTLEKVFHCQRRVRQGDPHSPLLFVLAADLLQSIINKIKDSGLLRLPINVGYTRDFSIVQYADDTLLIMKARPQ
jgi:hypothetical protein